MKSTLLMALTSLLLLTQCRKPSVEFPVPEDDNTVNMTVTVGHGRTDITGDGAIKWSENDKLYVSDGTKYIGCLDLVGDPGSAEGTFGGTVVADDGNYTFHFFYLGSIDYTTKLTEGDSESVDIDFSSQTGRREDLSRCHVGHGSAAGKVSGGNVILDSSDPVTMTSKVAIAYLEFKKGDADYNDALTLGGTNICNAMTVNFNGESFEGKKVGAGGISLTNTTSAQKYVMLVPTGTSEETLYFGGAGVTGSTTLYRGIEANKLYRMADGGPIGVSVVDAYVDLGLTVKWATINLGATSPQGYGDYYAWGETLPYYANGYSQESPCTHWRSMTTGAGNTTISNGYGWLTYSQGGTSTFTEWTNNPYGSNNILTSDYDAATVNWGDSWRMPTEAEFNELLDNDKTTRVWTENYNGTGVKGYVVTSKVAGHAGNSIFLPLAGYRSGKNMANLRSSGYYWSSTLTETQTFLGRALLLNSDSFLTIGNRRYYGLQVRPVRPSQN